MKQKKTVFRLFWAWEFEKEEQWLNLMAQQGWALDKVGFCVYTFVRCEPGEYIIRLEMHGADRNYTEFMQELNAEYIGRCVQWCFFRRKAEYGAFDIFSDIDSRISHLNKIGATMLAVGFLNLGIGVINTITPTHDIGILNLLLASLIMYGAGRIHGKKEELQKHRTIME